MASQSSSLLDAARRRLRAQGDSDVQRGTAAEDSYIDRAQGYNAQEAAGTAARANFDQFRETLNRDVKDLRGSQVGRGRLDTGFGFQDEDRLVTDSADRLNRTLAQNAMNAESLNLRNQEGIGQFGARVADRGVGNIVGQRDEAAGQFEAERAEAARKKRSKYGFLGKLAGGVAGTLLGPAGSALGAKLGGALAARLG